MFSFVAEGFSWSLDALYGGLGMSNFDFDLKSECRNCFDFLMGTIGRLFIRFNRLYVASNSIKTLKN